MDRETLELLVFVGMCLAASYLLMRESHAYLDAVFSRSSRELWADVWKRAHAKHDLNRKTQLGVFGSKWATVGDCLLVVGLVIAGVWFLTFIPAAAVLLTVYLAWELYATRGLGLTANDVYARLLKRDRITHCLLHAALWPFHASQAKNQSSNQWGIRTMTNQLFSCAGVRYEVTLDVLGAIIAHHSGAITTEREKATPDRAVIIAAQKAKDKLRTIREDLDPNADEAIERVIIQYSQQARDLYQ